MINYDLIERNKNKIINFGIIILALLVALQIHRSTDNQINFLILQKDSELEKNKVVEDIASLEKKAAAYKRVFVNKDLASAMYTISAIAKNTSVEIASVKPFAEEALDNYTNSSFLINLVAPSYHALSDFVSKIENHQDIYLISEISINSTLLGFQAADAKVNLDASLKINSISYL